MAPIIGRLSYPFVVIDLAAGEEVACDGYRLIAVPTVHRRWWPLVAGRGTTRPDGSTSTRRAAAACPRGRCSGRLHAEDVALPDGTMIRAPTAWASTASGGAVTSGDTRPCDGVLAASLGADLLIHEATSW